MKKKIIILGSTGSIGISTLNVIKKDKKNFQIILLTANNNYKKLAQQAKEFKVKNILIKNKNYLLNLKKLLKNRKIKIYSGDIAINKIVKKKVDYTMSAIVGLAGLQPTIDSIKISKNLAIANKETIICGWNIISNLVKKFNTRVLPVDSEHFSIYELTKNFENNDIKEIIITASGGPFLKTSLNKLKNVKPKEAINHPIWNMGKKISVDSSNLMNKVFEVIEAYRIFTFDKNKYKIIIHPQSYVHSIIRFKNGITKMILYNADMKIPISNILYENKNIYPNSKSINIKTLNKMEFHKVNSNKFPSTKIIGKCLNLGQSAPIIVNAANEVLVKLFLDEKIKFLDIVTTINKIFRHKEFKKYAKKKPKSVNDILKVDNWARLKTIEICV
jgi:1-deoxy-D-xylulose-5-phosphate reductoisomerase